MNRSALLASTAIALILCAAPAAAQMQQKSDDRQSTQVEKPTPKEDSAGSRTQRGDQGKSGDLRDKSAQDKSGDSQGKGSARSDAAEKGKGSTAEKGSEAKEMNRKSTAEQNAEPKGKQGTAERNEPKGKQGTAERNEPKGKQGTAERTSEPKDRQGTAGNANEPKSKSTQEQTGQSREKSASGQQKNGARVQLSEQQRTNLHERFSHDRNFNRVNNVNFSINVGTRVPRSVRLVALPATVIEIVPQYRNYRYFAVNDEICIVEPTTFEIVDVIRVQGNTVAGGGGGRLILSPEERQIVLREVDVRSDSTLGIGVLSEGSSVPREARLREFPVAVIDQVPKLKGHRYFTAEGRLAITDPDGSKIGLVIEDRR